MAWLSGRGGVPVELVPRWSPNRLADLFPFRVGRIARCGRLMTSRDVSSRNRRMSVSHASSSDKPFQARSAAGRIRGPNVVFTLGYQRRRLEEVLEIVRQNAVEQVVDVRENARSRKPGFSSPELRAAFGAVGIRYTHLPELGCASVARHELWRGGGAQTFLEEYRRRLSDRPRALEILVERTRSARTLLLCLERDPGRCHRAVLSEELRARGFSTQDL